MCAAAESIALRDELENRMIALIVHGHFVVGFGGIRRSDRERLRSALRSGLSKRIMVKAPRHGFQQPRAPALESIS